MSFTQQFLAEVQQVVAQLDASAIEKCADELAAVRERGGRLFILGVGGSAGNAGHAVNDFRKIGGIEAYAPTDNVSELTARTNDEGWPTIFSEWLKGSRLGAKDGLLIFSVGGGNVEKMSARTWSTRSSSPNKRAQRSLASWGRSWHRGSRRRLYGEGSDCVYHCADGESRSHHAAQRSFPGGHLASVGLASEIESGGDEVGKALVNDVRSLRRRNRFLHATFRGW